MSVYTPAEVAEILRISVKSVLLAMSNGDLPYRALSASGKYKGCTQEDIEGFLRVRARRGSSVGSDAARPTTVHAWAHPKLRLRQRAGPTCHVG
jgi:hypothetical protein